MTDDQLIARFEDCSLEFFHHCDHVRLAFLHLSRFPALEAVQRFSTSLARFATAKGKPGLYNETITWAFLFLIRERMVRAGEHPDWTRFEEKNQDLMSWKDNVLKNYYREETLSSELAKKIFLLPDKNVARP